MGARLTSSDNRPSKCLLLSMCNVRVALDSFSYCQSYQFEAPQFVNIETFVSLANSSQSVLAIAVKLGIIYYIQGERHTKDESLRPSRALHEFPPLRKMMRCFLGITDGEYEIPDS